MIHHWSDDGEFVKKEFVRMGFDKDNRWKISYVNKNFDLCNTYPRFLIIPSSFKDDDLESVAKFRYFRRIPTAVWRHIKNGCFIVRSSQPTVGWFGWFRNDLDENLVQSYVTNSMPLDSDQNDDDDDIINNFNQIDNNKNHESVDNNDDQCDQQTLVDENEQQDDDQDTSQNITTHLEQINLIEQKNHLGKLDDSTAILCQPSIETTTTLSSSNNHSIGNGKINPTNSDSSIRLESDLLNIETSTSVLPIVVNGNGTLPVNNSISSVNDSDTVTTLTSKMLIIDARSYTAAMANRAKGGGCECSEYYQRCEVQFMNLANIHSIRKSFHAIRSVCEAYSEQSNNWLSFLDNSRWLHHISGLLKSALLIVDTIDIEEKSILIHCSDGWDRTPQLVALAEIMLDPHYRTFDGFRTLIQREWLDFGHKFADRCGSNPCNEDPNERCPVFLQWLDCVQQLLMQYPKHFEFNSLYLDKLNRHTYSNVFGTFSYNSTQERILSRVDDRMLSLWSYFDSSRRRFRNDKYVESDEILRPSFKVRDLHFWKEVYLPPLRNQTPFMPVANNIDNKKFYDSLYIDQLTRTVCK